jgi:amidase
VDGALITRYQPPLGPGVAERFAWARQIPDAKLAEGQAYRARFRAHMAALLGHDGVLLLPTMPDIAPLIGAGEQGLESYRNRALQLLCVAGLAGLPQLSLPWATRLDAPLGLSLVGPPGSDRSLVALAQRISA